MGMLFSALLRADIANINDDRIRCIERTSPSEARAIVHMEGADYSAAVQNDPGWFGTDEAILVSIPRPSELRGNVTLRTDQGFYFDFGNGAVQVVYPLSWGIFLKYPKWRRPLISACLAYAQILGAMDGVVTSDDGPLAVAFDRGLAFDEILEAGRGKDDEVRRIDDMLALWDDGVTWDSHGYWYFLRDGRPVPIDNEDSDCSPD